MAIGEGKNGGGASGGGQTSAGGSAAGGGARTIRSDTGWDNSQLLLAATVAKRSTAADNAPATIAAAARAAQEAKAAAKFFEQTLPQGVSAQSFLPQAAGAPPTKTGLSMFGHLSVTTGTTPDFQKADIRVITTGPDGKTLDQKDWYAEFRYQYKYDLNTQEGERIIRIKNGEGLRINNDGSVVLEGGRRHHALAWMGKKWVNLSEDNARHPHNNNWVGLGNKGDVVYLGKVADVKQGFGVVMGTDGNFSSPQQMQGHKRPHSPRNWDTLNIPKAVEMTAPPKADKRPAETIRASAPPATAPVIKQASAPATSTGTGEASTVTATADHRMPVGVSPASGKAAAAPPARLISSDGVPVVATAPASGSAHLAHGSGGFGSLSAETAHTHHQNRVVTRTADGVTYVRRENGQVISISTGAHGIVTVAAITNINEMLRHMEAQGIAQQVRDMFAHPLPGQPPQAAQQPPAPRQIGA